MSRKIDLSQELSSEDLHYLMDRWDMASLNRNAIETGKTLDEVKAPFYEERANPNAVLAPLPTSAVPTPTQGSHADSTADPADATTDQGDGPTVRSFADPELAEKSYDEWTNDQLKAEISKRNELYGEEFDEYEPMSATGNKSALVEVLQQDDRDDAED
jgi:hypothetical protein